MVVGEWTAEYWENTTHGCEADMSWDYAMVSENEKNIAIVPSWIN